MEPESILQSYLVRIGQLISQQPIETVSDLRDTTVKTIQRQICRWTDHPIIQVNGFTEQFPDLGCPCRSRQPLKDSFQIPELMLETDLKVPGRCLHLRAETVADPDIGDHLFHQITDNLGVATWNNLMISTGLAEKYPVPLVAAFYPGAGLVTLHHCA